MNQQRSRRFRAAQEAQTKEETEDKLRQEWSSAVGLPSVSADTESKPVRFDSNCITPGTPFMAHLAECLRYYVLDKLNTDPGWRNLKVILSDASVPGEGEHKIMEFIRRQRSCPTHDPNTKHVLYGLDADLSKRILENFELISIVMLGLATHEPHFKILREDVFAQEGNVKACYICNQPGHEAAQCRGNRSIDLCT